MNLVIHQRDLKDLFLDVGFDTLYAAFYKCLFGNVSLYTLTPIETISLLVDPPLI